MKIYSLMKMPLQVRANKVYGMSEKRGQIEEEKQVAKNAGTLEVLEEETKQKEKKNNLHDFLAQDGSNVFISQLQRLNRRLDRNNVKWQIFKSSKSKTQKKSDAENMGLDNLRQSYAYWCSQKLGMDVEG